MNRKDAEGNNVFQGGFLGLDNIGVFDRSAPLPTGGIPGAGRRHQLDGDVHASTCCAIALELAQDDPAYEDVASKFWEHFLYIADAMNHRGNDGQSMWDEEDGFFYDVLHLPDGQHVPMKVRSMVGLIPLFAVETLDPELLDRMPASSADGLVHQESPGPDRESRLHATARARANGGCYPSSIRNSCAASCATCSMRTSFSRPTASERSRAITSDHPYVLNVDGMEHRVDYEPGESRTGMFGGNSNWRGPIWFPMNFLLIESLQRFHHYLGDDFKVECPTGSGQYLTLWEVAAELSRRLSSIFTRNGYGGDLCTAESRSSNTTDWRISSCSTSTFMATPAQAWAPATKRDGRLWSRN